MVKKKRNAMQKYLKNDIADLLKTGLDVKLTPGECPEECREAVASLIFAAARFADVPELRQLRSVFTERYGTFLECYVSKAFLQNLNSEPPTKEMNLQLMKDIASESGIAWNSKA